MTRSTGGIEYDPGYVVTPEMQARWNLVRHRASMTANERRDFDRLARERAIQVEEDARDAERIVYFIEGGDHVKIGSTENIVARMKSLQNGNPHKLKVILSIKGGYRRETAIRWGLRSSRVRGEWFCKTPALAAVIQGLQHEAI